MFKTLPPSPNPNPNLSSMTPFSSSISTPSPPSSSAPPHIHHVSFNQDFTCFALATDRGLFVYHCDTLKQAFRRHHNSSFDIVQMLFQSNVIACVGTVTHPGFSSNKLMIWDDRTSRYRGEQCFRSQVIAVRLRNDRIVAVFSQKVQVYRYEDFKPIHVIETYPNDKGLCEVSYGAGNMVLVCLALRKGEVRVEHYGLRKTKFIVPHNSSLACLALTTDGKLLATASIQGTLVRVYDTLDGLLLQEVRRGAFIADIYSLAFSSTAQWLAVSSDKGTVHVFSLKVDSRSSSVTSAVSSLSFIKGMLPKYFSSEWSVAQFRVPECSQYIVGFGQQENTVMIVGMDGSFYRCQFDPDSGGEMKQLEFRNVLKLQEEEEEEEEEEESV